MPPPTMATGAVDAGREGSMLELHSSVRSDEWELIVEETTKYKLFLECLKETAFPILEEVWTKEYDWFMLQLEIAISRIRNIDPMIMLKWNQDKIKEEYTKKMKSNAIDLAALIDEMRNQYKSLKVSSL